MELIGKGTNGTLIVKENTIELVRTGITARLLGLRGTKEILIKNITSIQYKKPGMLTNGFIQFAFSGSKESKGGVLDATKDENSIVFEKSAQSQFEKLKDVINEKRNASEVNHSILQQALPENDIYSQIEKLSALKEKGIITLSEFEAKKKQLLGI